MYVFMNQVQMNLWNIGKRRNEKVESFLLRYVSVVSSRKVAIRQTATRSRKILLYHLHGCAMCNAETRYTHARTHTWIRYLFALFAKCRGMLRSERDRGGTTTKETLFTVSTLEYGTKKIMTTLLFGCAHRWRWQHRNDTVAMHHIPYEQSIYYPEK